MYWLTLRYYLFSFVLFVSIRLLPLRQVFKWQKLKAGEHITIENQEIQQELITLRRLIKRIRKYAGWRFKCLEQSLLIMRYCRKRHMPATLYLGANVHTENLKAHAWVVIGDNISFDTHAKGGYKSVASYCFVTKT
jgi:hypothetical protein